MSKKRVFSDTATSRYSLALYELAEESNSTQEIENQCSALNKLINENKDFELLIKNPINKKEDQINIINKISEWPKCVEVSSQKLEPHRIPIYLYQLSALFHSYWNMGKDNESMRFLDKSKKLNKNKAVLLNSVLKTIGTGMKILDVETPETM